MKLFLKVFFVLILMYHILYTFLAYQIGIDNFILSASKDIIWAVFIILVAIYNFSKLKKFILGIKNYLFILIAILLVGFLVSIYNGKTYYDILVGVKYDLQIFFIFLSSVFIGFLFYKKNGINSILNIMNYLFYSIIGVLFFGILWQALKFTSPDLFFKIGYTDVGDYSFGQSPPIYYRTGPDGIPRLSGIFSGPNNLGYLLILFSGFFFYKIYLFLKKNPLDWKYSISGLLYIFSAIATLSRGVIVGLLPQIYVWLKGFFGDKINKKTVSLGVFIIFALLLFLSYIKGGSTIQHFEKPYNALIAYLNNPWGFGFGSSGPAIHHNGSNLPENLYLQILIEIGFLGFILWCLMFFNILKDIKLNIFLVDKKNLSSNELKLRNYMKYFSIGLFGLMLEGMFLHVFEDSMVNYMFFIPFGIIFGYFYFRKN